MIPEIGHFALILALAIALVQSIVPLVGAARGLPNLMAVARPAAIAQCLSLVTAFACLAYAFLVSDFSVTYVANNSNSRLPIAYRFSAVWGAHEGSLLLWALILSFWTTAVAFFSRSLPLATVARVLSVMGMISIGFLLFMLLTSNPFERLVPAAAEGRDLNPLLQDPGLVMHPPMLYMGYVGFSVAFAFATAALIGGHLDAAWARWSRPWTAVAWVFLTVGIALGSWWAYYELGWGGWWFWDPVENASFMPWLVGTALMHSLAVTEKRGVFKSWTVLLALIAFSLSLLGTFLVRSGVLTSVHAFATDPTRGVFILGFLALVIGGSLTLYAWRGPSIREAGGFELVSRESMLLVNNVLLVVAAATILLGTLYPLALDAFNLGKISVGPPYFDAVFVPLMLPLLFLLGVGPRARWKQADPMELARRLRWHFAISLGLAVVALLATVGMAAIMTFVSIALALWVTLTTLDNLRVRVMAKNNLWTGLTTTPRAFYGMTLAHLGVAVFAVGVTLVSAYSVEKDVKLAPGESYELAGHRFRFDGVRPVNGPNYRAEEGRITVFKGEHEVAQLAAQKRIYLVQRSPMTEAAIDPGLTRDLYVALGDPLGDGAWSVRLYYKPFVRWIWLGALIMAFGGILAAADPRYRLAARRRAAQATEAAPATSRA
jgi:cytochrome c-type biogenesis protein CcmF